MSLRRWIAGRTCSWGCILLACVCLLDVIVSFSCILKSATRLRSCIVLLVLVLLSLICDPEPYCPSSRAVDIVVWRQLASLSERTSVSMPSNTRLLLLGLVIGLIATYLPPAALLSQITFIFSRKSTNAWAQGYQRFQQAGEVPANFDPLDPEAGKPPA